MPSGNSMRKSRIWNQKMNEKYRSYIKIDMLPTLFCPGCGNGIIQNATIEAIDKLGIRKDTAFVSGIGCSSWIPCYFDMDVIHSIHGRALPVAQGLKLAAPGKNIIVFSGDGDCYAIGGNHFIHAIRRNIDLTILVVNNHIYGMTGGQVSPTTLQGSKTKTSPYGAADEPIDGCRIAIAMGAGFVARWTVSQPIELAKSITEAISHKGFSMIEIIAQCPEQAGGKVYKEKNPSEMMLHFKDLVRQGTIKTGILHKDEKK